MTPRIGVGCHGRDASGEHRTGLDDKTSGATAGACGPISIETSRLEPTICSRVSTDLFVDLTAEVSGEDLDSLFDAWFSVNARSHRFARPFEGVKVLAKAWRRRLKGRF